MVCVVRMCAILFLNEWFDGDFILLYICGWVSRCGLYRWNIYNKNISSQQPNIQQWRQRSDDGVATFLCQYTETTRLCFWVGVCLNAMIVFVYRMYSWISALTRSVIYLYLLQTVLASHKALSSIIIYLSKKTTKMKRRIVNIFLNWTNKV